MINFIPTLKVLLLFLAILPFMPVQASTFFFDLSRDSWSLDDQVSYRVAKEGQSISDVIKLNDGWQSPTPGVLNLGIDAKSYWLKVDLMYNGAAFQEWWLEVAEPSLQKLDVYWVSNNRVEAQWPGGNHLPFERRMMDHRHFIFPLTFFSEEKVSLLFFVKSGNSLQVPLRLWQQGAYLGHTEKMDLVLGIFFGALMLMALYNLFIYFNLKDRSYLFYVAFVMALAFFQACIQGIMYEFFWSSSPWWQQHCIGVSMGILLFFGIYFVIEFLDLKNRSPGYFKVLKTSAWGALALILPMFFFYEMLLPVMIIFSIVAVCIAIASAWRCWQDGYEPAKILWAAWVFMLGGSGILALNKFALIPRNALTENAQVMGVVLVVLLMSLGLAYRIGQVNKRRFRAQRRLLNEVREREVVEQQLLYQSLHDPITDLPNLQSLEHHFPAQVADLKSDQGMALILISLQGFHEISNTLGHTYGDDLLRMAATRLQQTLENLHTVDPNKENFAHVTGVTFALLLKSSEPLNRAVQIARQLVDLMSSPFILQEMAIDVGCCVGISLYGEHGKKLSDLRRNAQIALEVAQKGGDRFAIYADSINPYSERRLLVMGHLRQALAENQLQLYYQPQLHLPSKKILSVEALVRWKHPQLGQISPAEFVPLVEKTGLVRDFTQWVLETALAEVAALREENPGLRVSVNYSAKNLLEADLAPRLVETLQSVGLPADALMIEVTETAVMTDPERALNVLKLIDHLGIAIAIDDFGTGYSSLAYLKQLPVKEIKIDSSFIFNMCTEKDDEAVVKTAINLGHDLGIEVVAEGIEDQDTLERLSSLSCDKIQGYHLARPMPLSQFRVWLYSYNTMVERLGSESES